MCRVLRISRSGYYAWDNRPPSARARADLWLTEQIEAIHRRSRGVYGSPMIHAELADDHGVRVGRKRVARLMRGAGLRGASLRRFVITTTSDPKAKRPPDLVERRFSYGAKAAGIARRSPWRSALFGWFDRKAAS